MGFIMEKIYYVCFEIHEYGRGVMGSTEFIGTRDEFKKYQLKEKAHMSLVKKELI